jgi:hypothetical protein
MEAKNIISFVNYNLIVLLMVLFFNGASNTEKVIIIKVISYSKMMRKKETYHNVNDSLTLNPKKALSKIRKTS